MIIKYALISLLAVSFTASVAVADTPNARITTAELVAMHLDREVHIMQHPTREGAVRMVQLLGQELLRQRPEAEVAGGVWQIPTGVWQAEVRVDHPPDS